VTYMNYGVFHTALAARGHGPPTKTSQTAETIIQSVLPSSSKTQNLALALLRSSKAGEVDISRTLREAREHRKTRSTTDHPFHKYSSAHFAEHVVHIDKSVDETVWPLLLKALRGYGSASGNAMVPQRQRTFFKALTTGNEGLATELLNHEWSIDPDAWDDSGHVPLELAIAQNLPAPCQILLNRRQANSPRLEGPDLLSKAIRSGNHSAIHSLFKADERLKNITSARHSGFEDSPVVWATEVGTPEVMKALLDDWGLYREPWRHQVLEAAMTKAAKLPDLRMAQAIKDSGPWFHCHKDEHDLSVMYKAAMSGDARLVQVLHDVGDEFFGCTNYGKNGTPFVAAARAGHENVMRVMLEHENHRPQKTDELNAMKYAGENNYDAIVQLLERWPEEKARRAAERKRKEAEEIAAEKKRKEIERNDSVRYLEAVEKKHQLSREAVNISPAVWFVGLVLALCLFLLVDCIRLLRDWA